MKGAFVNIYTRKTVINWGCTGPSSCLVTPADADQTSTRTLFGGKEKEFSVYKGIDCLAL